MPLCSAPARECLAFAKKLVDALMLSWPSRASDRPAPAPEGEPAHNLCVCSSSWSHADWVAGAIASYLQSSKRSGHSVLRTQLIPGPFEDPGPSLITGSVRWNSALTSDSSVSSAASSRCHFALISNFQSNRRLVRATCVAPTTPSSSRCTTVASLRSASIRPSTSATSSRTCGSRASA